MAMSVSEPPAPAVPTPPAKRPRIREMTRRQIDFVLARNVVARVAFVADGRVELQPVHYVYTDGAIVGRIALGTKYLNWLVVSEVVVEVEEVEGLFDWRSIIVRGSLSLLRARGTPEEHAAYAKAVDAIRTLIPAAFTENDPTPNRAFVFRVEPTQVTGREATAK